MASRWDCVPTKPDFCDSEGGSPYTDNNQLVGSGGAAAIDNISIMDNLGASFEPEGQSNGDLPTINGDNHYVSVSPVTVAEKRLQDQLKNSPSCDQDPNRLSRRINFLVNRPVYNQPEFDEDFEGGPRFPKSCDECCRNLRSKCICSPEKAKKVVKKVFPFVSALKAYNVKTELVGDIVAGLTVGIMQIPQGMAYAMLAGLDPVYGLYTSFFPVLLYFFFGTSKHVSLGTFAVVSLMVGSTVDKICPSGETLPPSLPTEGYVDFFTNGSSNGSSGAHSRMTCKIGVATATTFIAGIIQLGMGIAHLGFVTIYLSEPLTRGFTTGASMHVFTSQVKYVFGVSVPRHSGPLKLIFIYRDMFSNILTTNPAPVVMAIVCMIMLFIVKEFANPIVKRKVKAPIPIDLIVVILATVASHFGKFNERYDMQIVGFIPRGIPPPRFPPQEYFGRVIGDAFAIAIVSFAISVSMVQLFGKKHNYPVDANQELVAYGISNMVSSNFQCYQMCVSLSRSMVQESVGGMTQVAGLIGSLLVLIVILALANLFESLPNCVLAAIIIIALKGLFMQFLDLKKLWFLSKWDWSVWLVTFLGVFLLDVDLGLVVGVGWSFLITVFRTQRPYCSLMGHVPTTDMYQDIKVHKRAREIPGIKIFGFEGPVYFPNRNYFLDSLYRKTRCNPKKLKMAISKIEGKIKKSEAAKRNDKNRTSKASLEDSPAYEIPKPSINYVIIDCSTMGFVDTMGVGALRTVISEYKEVGVTVYLAGCKGGLREMLESGEFYAKIDRGVLFPTIHDAVIACLEGNLLLENEYKDIRPMDTETHL